MAPASEPRPRSGGLTVGNSAARPQEPADARAYGRCTCPVLTPVGRWRGSSGRSRRSARRSSRAGPKADSLRSVADRWSTSSVTRGRSAPLLSLAPWNSSPVGGQALRLSSPHTRAGCDLFFYASLSGEEPIPPKGPTGEVWRNFAKTTTTRAELDRDYRSLLDRWEGLARRPEDPAAASAFVAELFALHGAKIPKWQGLPLDTDIIRFHFESAGLPWPY